MVNRNAGQFFQEANLTSITGSDPSNLNTTLEIIHAHLRSLVLSSNYLKRSSAAKPDKVTAPLIQATRECIGELLSLDLKHPYGEQCTFQILADAILAKLQKDPDIQRVKNAMEPLSQLVRDTCNECARTAQHSAYTPL